MPPASTLFREAVRSTVSAAAGIAFTIDGERTGPSGDDVVAVWTNGSVPRADNTQFRMIGATARVILARDAEVGPDDDDPLGVMESIENAVLAAIPPILGGARVDMVDVTYDTNVASIDFVFVGEVANVAPEV